MSALPIPGRDLGLDHSTPVARSLSRDPHALVWACLALSGSVVVLMMALGVWMRLAQAGATATLPPVWFYRVLTLHGVGMIGISGLAGAAILWHFLGRHVDLSARIFAANLVFFLIGVLLLFGPVLFAGYAGTWTFLYPLPRLSGGAWEPAAAAVHLGGLLLVGVGFLLLHLDIARALQARYGSVARALGWPQLFGASSAEAPPPAVVASAVVLIVNVLGLVAGASILTMTIVNALAPGFAIDALLAKNLTFFFGHVFINAAIYMGVIAVYEVLPLYTGRPWKTSRLFLAAWSCTALMVIIVYPHHLLMDLSLPAWMRVMGQVISYASGLPVLLVSALGGLALVYRSGIRWDIASALLFLSLFGWSAGVIPAVIDGTIAVNRVMHNTQWVPGHFHFYLLLGLFSMVFGFMYHVTGRTQRDSHWDRAAFAGYVIGGLGVVLSFLAAGSAGVPRRYAVHMEPWTGFDLAGALAGALVATSTALLTVRCFLRARSST
jgi:cytochrome c oxidase subunit I